MSPGIRGSPKAVVSSIKAILVNCDGPMFQYTPIFDHSVLQLVSKPHSGREKEWGGEGGRKREREREAEGSEGEGRVEGERCDISICEQVQTLRQKIHHAKMVLSQRLTPSVEQRGSPVQPPPSPSLSFSSFSPGASSRAPAALSKPQSQIKRSASCYWYHIF